MALLRSKLVQKLPLNHPSSTSSTSESNAQKWKRKAKERKKKISSKLKCNLSSPSCKCYYFDHLGKLSTNQFGNDSDKRFNDVLCPRFMRQVRLSEKRRMVQRRHMFFLTVTVKMKVNRFGPRSISLWSSVTIFLLLTPVEETNFLSWSHRTVDFILVLGAYHLKSSVIIGISRHPVAALTNNHLIRKRGSESFVGQHVILSVSQRNAVLGESLLFMDPFDDAFPNMHDYLYMMSRILYQNTRDLGVITMIWCILDSLVMPFNLWMAAGFSLLSFWYQTTY